MDEPTSTTAPTAEGVVVPRRCTLDGFATEVSQTDGIGLADLDPITTLLVRTQNSLYQIVVVQPRQKAVLVLHSLDRSKRPERVPGRRVSSRPV